MSGRHVVRVAGTERVYDRRIILFIVLMFMMMAMMAVSSVNVALPAMQDGLGASDTDLQWVLTGYALMYGITLVPAGRAGDALGRGSLFIAGVAIFMLASLACGLANDALVLNLARLLQGLGAGLTNPQVTGIIQQYYAGEERARAFGYFGLVISASVAVGPLVAGVIIAATGPQTGWRWAFLMNTPVGLIAIILALLFLPFERERELWRARRTERIRVDLDPVGTTMLALVVLCAMLPFMVREHPAIWALLPVAAILLLGWVRWERRYQRRGGQPVVDLNLFSFPSFSNMTRISAIVFSAQPAAYVLLALYVQNGMGGSALITGLIGLPSSIASGFASVLLSKYVLSKGASLIRASLVVMLISALIAVLVVQLDASFDIGYGWLAVPLAVSGMGMGIMISASQTIAMQDVPPHQGGTAGGVKMTTERVGTAMGVAVITGIFFSAFDAWGWVPGYQIGLLMTVLVYVVALGFTLRPGRHSQGATQPQE